MATIGGTMATAGDVRKEQAEARVIERRRRLEEERKMRCAPLGTAAPPRPRAPAPAPPPPRPCRPRPRAPAARAAPAAVS